MSRGATWGSADLTGGPIDEVFAALRRAFPDVKIERLAVTHSADDDNVWFISRMGKSYSLQIDSMPNGEPPFLLESDASQRRTDNAVEAIHILTEWLENE